MSTVERDLERTLNAVHHDRPVPAGLFERVERRRRRNRATAVVAGVATVAVVAAGSAAVFTTRDETALRPAMAPPSLTWTKGTITVNHRLDDVVDAESVIGVLDRHHVLVSPFAAEGAKTYRLLVVDLRTGKARKIADIPVTTRGLGSIKVLNSKAGRNLATSGGEAFTGDTFVYVKDKAIRGLDVRTGEDRVLVAGADPWALAAGDGMLAWRGPGVGAATYTRPVAGGKVVRVPGVRSDQSLDLDRGKLVTYDHKAWRVFDPLDGSLVSTVPLRTNPEASFGGEASCTSTFCVRDVPTRPHRSDTDFRIRIYEPSGDAHGVPGNPRITYLSEGKDSQAFFGTYAHGPYVLWSTAGPKHDRVRSLLYDTRSKAPVNLGQGSASFTYDGWVVRGPKLTGSAEDGHGGQGVSIEVEIAKLPR